MGTVLAREAEPDSRKRTISFSSEEPYRRYFGLEILDHGEGAMDLSRLNEVGVVLFNHDTDRVVGKVLRAWVENSRGMAEIEFDTDEDAEKVFRKVQSGTLKTTSVRYAVDAWEEVKAGEEATDGRFAGPCRIARRWTPLEVSIVSVPADATVGVGRSEAGSQEEEVTQMEETNQTQERAEEQAQAVGPEEARRAVEAERQRVSGIMALCRQTGMDPEEHINSGAALDAVRAAALDYMLQHGAPVVVGARDSGLDSFRDAARDAMLLQAGVELDRPAPGAEDMRGMSMRDMLIECMARGGEGTVTELLRRSRAELWDTAVRQFFSSTADFPAILDNAVKKAIVQQYELTPATFELWTSKGTLPDFKTSKEHEYAMGGGDFQKVTEGGEIKASTLQTELLPTRKLDTYATQFSMTREAFINDDIGFLANMPAQYSRKAKQKINRQVYELLLSNPAIFDGAPLFDAAHKNLISEGSAPSVKAIERMIQTMGMQTDQFGESIMVEPAVILVPMGWGMKVKQILGTAEIDVEGIGSHTVNVLNTEYGTKIKVLQEAALNLLAKDKPCPWFMAADPRLAKSVQVDYLNGAAAPSFRRSEKAGYLGYLWDIWLDWGINAVDFRGILRNDGAALGE